jgi:hypothetical protein
VAKLAAHSILAVVIASHVGLAKGHSELGGDMRLLHELVVAVGESALGAEFAVLAIKPELANFSLLLLLVSGLKRCHVIGRVVSLISRGARHPENWSAGLEALKGGRLELCAGRLHSGHGGKEAFAFSLRKKSHGTFFVRLLNIFVGSSIVGDIIRHLEQ